MESPVNGCAAVTDLLAAEAVDATDSHERLEVRQHLASCARCSDELEVLRQGAALLGSAVPQVEPPRELRTRVLASALAERPPGSRPSGTAPALLGRRPTPLWGAVAAAVLVSLGSLTWAASLQGQLASVTSQVEADRERAERYERVVGVLASPGLTTRDLEPSDGASPARGTVYLDPRSGQGMIMVHDLPSLPPSRTWQLWFVRGEERVSGGLVWTDPAGRGYSLLNVPSDLPTFDAVGITDEPAGGSSSPTGTRVIGTPL